MLLSPAKNIEVAVAAIQAGADAVYIGAPRFGAREAAGNSIEDIAQVVEYAHRFGVEVHVTLNTLLQDDEYAEALQIAAQLYQIGIDALLVQDLELAKMLFEQLPGLALHASTQCDNRTIEQVKALRDMGFKQVVLARELSVKEIAAIHQAVPDILLEAFVHGALCVSYSGRCFLSEVLLGRSANRGCCAQMCRMAYDLLDADGNEIIDDNGQPIHQRYLLSLQDLDRSAYLQELIDAGVTTFKIEGRLKDAAYVTNITAFYRERLDQIAHHKSAITKTFTPDPTKTFHRGGIDYFAHGRTRPMANWQTPKSTGEYIGEVLSVRDNTLKMRLRDAVQLHNGDGLTVGDQGFYVNDIQGDTIRINKSITLPRETALYRNYDPFFLRSLHTERRVPVEVEFAISDNRCTLTYKPIDSRLQPMYREFEATFEAATNAERATQTVEQQLTKLGDTIYLAQRFNIVNHRTDGQVPFIPMAQLNAFRRETINSRPSRNPLTMTSPLCLTNKQRISNAPSELMTCRYCILYEMGHCRKESPLAIEPRYIRLQNGTKLQLQFNCSRCEMSILA